MTVIPWEDGQVLTAGSLRLLPQIMGNSNVSGGGIGSTAVGIVVGTVNVPAGTFSEQLVVSASMETVHVAGVGNQWAELWLSGPGLGGGSMVRSVQYSELDGEDINALAINAVLPANSGWIPASGADVQVRIRHDDAGNTAVPDDSGTLIVYGTGG